jgi:hypothetical protein
VRRRYAYPKEENRPASGNAGQNRKQLGYLFPLEFVYDQGDSRQLVRDSPPHGTARCHAELVACRFRQTISQTSVAAAVAGHRLFLPGHTRPVSGFVVP